jgi:predicted GNAT family N-acyltransferase
MHNVKAILIDKHSPLYQSELMLRFLVLREPIGMTLEQVTSSIEDQCLHFVLTLGNEVYGCVLLHLESSTNGRLLQMAVATNRQGEGLGSVLVKALEAHAIKLGMVSISLHSRVEASGFYSSLGYKEFGERFMEVGIEHVKMRKEL